MTVQTYWYCSNRDCGKALPMAEADRQREERFCDCGSLMKKDVQPAVFSYLDFLREPADEPGERPGKEQGLCAA